METLRQIGTWYFDLGWILFTIAGSWVGAANGNGRLSNKKTVAIVAVYLVFSGACFYAKHYA